MNTHLDEKDKIQIAMKYFSNNVDEYSVHMYFCYFLMSNWKKGAEETKIKQAVAD